MFVFLDLQTTGLQDDDKICSVGLVLFSEQEEQTRYDLINEGKKISAKASSIHNITNEMIKDKPTFLQSMACALLQEYNTTQNTLIAHNVPFDLQKLLACGIRWKGNTIDTLRVAKHLIPECEFFSLNFLRYELRLYKKEQETVLSNALGNAKITKFLYEYLLDYATHDEMCELSFKNVLLEKFGFGKYKDRYIEDIAMNDRGYLEWVLGNVMDLDEDLKYSINYYLKGCE